MSFVASSLLTSLGLALIAVFFAVGLVRKPDAWRRLPRAVWPGSVLAFICLGWAAWHVAQMLEGSLAAYRGFLPLLVPLITVLCAWQLDYLFARAFGGFLLLLVHHLLYVAFVADVPGRAVFSLVCYLLSLPAFVIVASPWRLRDLLKAATESSRVRIGVTAGLAAGAAFYAVEGLLG